MELLYLYVHNYTELVQKIGFQFSSKFISSYDEIDGRIKLDKNNKCINNMFGKTISEITAVVGNNGSGKTTILDVIGLDYKTRVETSEYYYDSRYYYKDKYFMMYHVREDIFYIEGLGRFNITNIYNITPETFSTTSKNNMKNREFFSFFFKKKENGAYEVLDKAIEEYLTDKNLSKIIYINDVFGSRRKEQIQKLSTGNELLISRSQVGKVNLVEWYRTYIDFCKEGYIKSRGIKIVFKKYEYRRNFSSSIYVPTKVGSEATKFLDEQSLITEESIEDFFRYFQSNILNNMLSIYYNKFGSVKRFYRYLDFLKELRDNDIAKYHSDIFEYFEKHTFKEMFQGTYESQENEHIITYYELMKKIFFALIDIKECIIPSVDSFEIEIAKTYNEKLVYFFKISNEIENFVSDNKEIISLYKGEYGETASFYQGDFKQNLLINPFSAVNFRMSKGEEKLITIFSKTFHEVNEYVRNCPIGCLKAKKDITIVIDEVDEAMHPEWARNLIFIMAKVLDEKKEDFFNKFYLSEITKVQLIFSTHSPFILSDLNNDNIIYLSREGYRLHLNDEMKKNDTFAQNIHRILDCNFFMHASIGEFSRQKINSVIDILYFKEKREDISIEKREEVRQIINIIGEPILKTKLEEMYYDMFPTESENINKLKEHKEFFESLLKGNQVEEAKKMLITLQKAIDDFEKNN
jgi:hypothetical protein